MTAAVVGVVGDDAGAAAGEPGFCGAQVAFNACGVASALISAR